MIAAPAIRRRVVRCLAINIAMRMFSKHFRGDAPWGGRGPWGFGASNGGRRFGRGDLKYVILDLLQDGPSHGYDIIKAIEERFHGFYTPSAGSVYPTLQLLEDQGYVTSTQEDGKRVYVITDEGRAFLKERAQKVEDIRTRAGSHGHSPEMRALIEEVRHIGQTLFSSAAGGGLRDADKVRRLREVIARAGKEIEAIFHEDRTSDEEMV